MYRVDDCSKQRLLKNYQLAFVKTPSFFGYASLSDESHLHYQLPFAIKHYLQQQPNRLGFCYHKYRPLSPFEYHPDKHPFCLIFAPTTSSTYPDLFHDFHPCKTNGQLIAYDQIERYYHRGQTILCVRPYHLIHSGGEVDHHCYILRPTAKHLADLRRTNIAPSVPYHLNKPASYIEKRSSITKPLITTPYALKLHYQAQANGQLSDQKYMYYHVIDAQNQHHLGMLDQQGQDTIKHLPAGSVKVYYGLTRDDANSNGQEKLAKQHQQLVTQLKDTLDNIIAKTKDRAKQQDAALKQKGMWGKGWVYTESFAKGFAKTTAALANSAIHTLTAPFSALDALADTMIQCMQQGSIDLLKQQYQQLAIHIKATEKDFKRLARLLADPTCRELIVNFPKRYWHAASDLQKAQMLGQLAPNLILAIVTMGDSALVEGSAEAGTLAESIGGETGTLARQAAQTSDTGIVDSETSELDTIKDFTLQSINKDDNLGQEFAKQKGIPNNWLIKGTKNNKRYRGIQYINPHDHRDRIRIMPGNPNHPKLNSRTPYVKRSMDGKIYNHLGIKVSDNSTDSHIPLNKFIFYSKEELND